MLSPSILNALIDNEEPYGDTHLPWFYRLWTAMIRRAAVDYVLYFNHEAAKLRDLGRDAHDWIFAENDESGASFYNVCLCMNLDPELVRERIKTLTVEYVRTLRGLDFEDG